MQTETSTVAKLAADYHRAYAVVLDNPPGRKGDAALERIERLVEKAEAAGVLDEFLAAALR